MSDRARAIARAVAAEVAARDGVIAVALTGSLARGDEAEGSDVDLWVVAAENGREDFKRDDVDVTLLVTSEAYARSLDCALRFEVELAEILHDEAGVVASVKERVLRDRDDVELAMRRASRDVFAFLSSTLVDAPPPLRLATLREMARRATALFLWRAKGLRVPKWRHVEQSLFPPDLDALRTALAFDDVDPDALARAFDEVRSERPPSVDWPWPAHEQVHRYLDRGRAPDAVICVRQALPPIPGASFDVLTDAARALFDVAHGAASQDVLERTEASTRRLLDRFETASLLPGRPALLSGSTAPSR